MFHSWTMRNTSAAMAHAKVSWLYRVKVMTFCRCAMAVDLYHVNTVAHD